MSIENIINKAWENKEQVNPNSDKSLKDTIDQIINELDSGKLRVAEKINGEWITHQHLKKGLDELGLKFLVDESSRLPSLNAIIIPDGVDDIEIRSALLNDYNIEIGGGLGPFAGKVWRIGLMGHSAQEKYVNIFLDAFKKVLN